MKIKTCDVGSMPFEGDYKKFIDESESQKKYFSEKIIQGFVDKFLAGIDIPNYPQYRDMNEMFLVQLDGVVKTKEGYIPERTIGVKEGKIELPEIKVLRGSLELLHEKIGEPVKIKICLTGPHTLSWMFAYKDLDILSQLADCLTSILDANLFKNKHGEIGLLSIDEPLLGIVDDSRLDYGSPGRDVLIKSWDKIFYSASSKGIDTILHLHNTRTELFWHVKNLKIIESHVNDQFYTSKQIKDMIERTDKFVKASIVITDFDQLIKQKLEREFKVSTPILQQIGTMWSDIRKGRADPKTFIESVETITDRLRKIVEWFGSDRVPYTGPECGMSSFPTYQSAIECFKRIDESRQRIG